MNKIKVIDCPMGFGKTSYLIQMINNNLENNKFLYTLFLLLNILKGDTNI